MKEARISPEQSGVATSPDVQEADKHVVGATDPGSEQPDDNTDSDSSTHSE